MEDVEGVEIKGDESVKIDSILTPDALNFLKAVVREFSDDRQTLLDVRKHMQNAINDGVYLPSFLSHTKNVREGDWKIKPVPANLQERKVEITGPASSRKMVINALNSGASVYMADAEDSESPTWDNIMQGQINLFDAVRGTIEFEDRNKNKVYKLNNWIATLMFRPRGWHLVESNVEVDGEPVSASMFDFCMYFFHNAKTLLENSSGPYFYLPKLESHREARLWNRIFAFAEKYLRIRSDSIKATVLIETLPAAFEMDEILYELRDHSAGLNCGRWDYLFSYIKTLYSHPMYVLPDRSQMKMNRGFLLAYAKLLVRTCHRRGAHAMGGMAAQIPIKNDPAANNTAMASVRADKAHEVKIGHDGTWVAHPGMVAAAREIFDMGIKGLNQFEVINQMSVAEADDLEHGLLDPIEGMITEEGLRTNLSVGLQYLESWLRGTGCVAINNLMEDAATVEICRSQVWQWLTHEARLNDGRYITTELVERMLVEEFDKVCSDRLNYYYSQAYDILRDMIFAPNFVDFLTIPAYKHLD